MGSQDTKQNGVYTAFLILIPAVFALTALDQWTKQLARLYLMGKEPIVLIKGVFELTYVENRGAAFGLFQNQRVPFLIGTLVIIAVVLVLYGRLPKTGRYLPLRIVAAGLLSGAAGNMIDRFLNGYVVDFFYFSLIDFPVFNAADIYVTVSMAYFVVLWLFYYKEEELDLLFHQKRAEKKAGG